MTTWNQLADAEPRLLDVLHAAITDMIQQERAAEHTYAAAKRLIDHLVGWRRGQRPQAPSPFAGPALRRLHTLATPFETSAGDWLADQDAYHVAMTHVHDRLADLEAPCPSCTSYQPAYGRRTTRTYHRCRSCSVRWTVQHQSDPAA